MRRAFPVLFFGLVVDAVACSVSTPPPDHTSFVSCEAIAVACHNRDIDEDGGTAEQCHVLAHTSRTEEACASKKDVCLRYCSGDGGPEAGIFEDANANDGGDEQ